MARDAGCRMRGTGGGCFETSRVTTHNAPVFTVDGIIHYCVANMPGAMQATGN